MNPEPKHAKIGNQSETHSMRILSWAFIVCSTPLAFVLIGLISGTSILALDGWNTTWNDELGYYYMTTMMHENGLGGTPGVYGYNERTIAGVAYGPYVLTTYYAYVIGTWFLDPSGHNIIYFANIAFSIIAGLVIVVGLRPSTRASVVIGCFFMLHFIIARYAASGMIEESFVAMMVVCMVCMMRVSHFSDAFKGLSAPAINVLYLITFVLIAFFSTMRPFFLAFFILPAYLLVFERDRLSRANRIVLFAVMCAATLASLGYHFDYRSNYLSPYFNQSETGSLLSDDMPNIFYQNAVWIGYTGLNLIEGGWKGIVLLGFFACVVADIVVAVRAHRSGNIRARNFAICLLAFALLVYEANVVLYTPKQAQRMFLPLVVAIVMFVAVYGAKRLDAVLCAICVVPCIAALILIPSDFALPQHNETSISAEEQARVESDLKATMPLSSEPWNNTCAKPVEWNNMAIYYLLPPHISGNVCQDDYLEESLRNDTLKSKYLCLPDSYEQFNALAQEKGELIYSYGGHKIYRMR